LAPEKTSHLLLPVVLLAATQWIEYTGLRMVYPFMPEIARGLGVDLAAVASVVALRSGLGLAGPLVGSFAERHSRKAMMILGMGIFGIGFLIVTVSPTFPAFVASAAWSSAPRCTRTWGTAWATTSVAWPWAPRSSAMQEPTWLGCRSSGG